MDEIEILSPEEALTGLRDCYSNHMDLLLEARTAGGLKESLLGWLGSGERKRARSAALDAFYQEALGRVEGLQVLLDEREEEAGDWAAQAIEVILFYPPKLGRDLDLALAAIEGLADPLLDYLPRETAAEIMARYRKRTPPRMMLPNQRKLFERLKEQAEE